MRHTFTFLFSFFLLSISAQEMCVKFDARVIENEFWQSDFVSACGDIRLTESSVTWSNGHREDINLLDVSDYAHPRYGKVQKYTWARGKHVYIAVYVHDYQPVELVRKAYDVVINGSGLTKGETVTYFFDLDSDSTFGSEN